MINKLVINKTSKVFSSYYEMLVWIVILRIILRVISGVHNNVVKINCIENKLQYANMYK